MEDLLTSPFLLAGIAFGAMGLVLAVAGLASLLRLRILGFAFRTVVGVAFLALGLFFGAVALGTQGYRAFEREEVAARIHVQPVAAQRFAARVRFADGREIAREIEGDEIYVDAHILKWKPVVNALGLHTAYELDRIAGRYQSIQQEATARRSVHALAQEKPFDLFRVRQRFAFLEPLVDAQYGSATFVPVARPMELEVRVSTTGLLMREVTSGS